MTNRRTPNYFITKKFVFDRTSHTRTKKALNLLENAKFHIMRNGMDEGGFDPTQETVAAWNLMSTASIAVNTADDVAQREAKARS